MRSVSDEQKVRLSGLGLGLGLALGGAISKQLVLFGELELVTVDQPDVYLDGQKVGNAQKEWWVTSDWSLGVLLGLQLFTAKNDSPLGERWNTSAGFLSFSAGKRNVRIGSWRYLNRTRETCVG